MLSIGFVLGGLIVPLIARAMTFEEEKPVVHSSDPTGLALVAPNATIESESDTSPLDRSHLVRTSYETERISALILDTFPEAPRMLQVAIAESSLIETAKNPKSSAKGIFAVLDGTWVAYGCTGDVLKAEDNIACAKVIHDRDGVLPWAASGPW